MRKLLNVTREVFSQRGNELCHGIIALNESNDRE